LNVFGRAELQRGVVHVVVLLVTAGSRGAFAREFRAAGTQNEEYPTIQAPCFMCRRCGVRALPLLFRSIEQMLKGLGGPIGAGQSRKQAERRA